MLDIKNDIATASQTILSGGTLLYPTDTIWGIGCDATNEKAVDKIYQIKNRPQQKSFIILLPNLKEVLKFVATPPINIQDIYSSFTKPTTVIFDNAINLPDNIINDDGSIAIRIPNDDFCKRLLLKIKVPLVSTSANLSGNATVNTFRDIDEIIKQQVDYIAYHKREDTAIHQPSSIVKVASDGTIKTIRP